MTALQQISKSLTKYAPTELQMDRNGLMQAKKNFFA